MLNLGDLGFLVFCGAIIGVCYYYMVVRKDKANLETAKNIVNEDEEILIEENQGNNPNNQGVNQPKTVAKAKSNLTTKQEAKRQARKEEKRRQREV
jgi:hypothetical protein